MTKAELETLRLAWAEAVILNPQGRPKRCWFSYAAGNVDAGLCEGRIEGAHWIKRQTVEKHALDAAWEPMYGADGEVVAWNLRERETDLPMLAAWDPRNGVPACNRHHTIFDSQRVPLPSERIVVWRHQVPAHVEAFARDWGMEHELDRKHDTIYGGI